MLLSLRGRAAREQPAPLQLRVGLKLFGWIASRPALYRIATGLGRRSLRLLARQGWVKKAPGLAAGWTSVRDLRAPAARTFQEQWRARKSR